MRPPATTILGRLSERLALLGTAPPSTPVDAATAFELQVLGIGAAALADDAERGAALRVEEHRALGELVRRGRALGLAGDVDDTALEAALETCRLGEADRCLAAVQQAVTDLHAQVEQRPGDPDCVALRDEIWATLAWCNGRRRGLR